MNTVDMQYLALCEQILQRGKTKTNRTGTSTIGLFGAQMRFDLSHGFPLLTTKRVNFDCIVGELFWFLSGSTNIRDLLSRGVNIWNDDAFRHNRRWLPLEMTKEEYINAVKTDPNFAIRYGDLGMGTYGQSWRNFEGVDQIAEVIKSLRTDPNSRRHIVMAWQPHYVNTMALPPCHLMFQFHCEPLDQVDAELSGRAYKLHLQMYQRSCDMFLGVPFNIASYALLLSMVAHCVNMVPGDFIHDLGDYHIYVNHIDQIRTMLSREPKSLPKLWIDPDKREMPLKLNFEEYAEYINPEDLDLRGYNPHDAIKGQLSTGL